MYWEKWIKGGYVAKSLFFFQNSLRFLVCLSNEIIEFSATKIIENEIYDRMVTPNTSKFTFGDVSADVIVLSMTSSTNQNSVLMIFKFCPQELMSH